MGSGGKIIVGVDGSTGSRAASAWALDEAEHRDAQVESIFVQEYGRAKSAEFEAESVRLVEQTLRLVSARTQIKLNCRVCHGSPAEVLRRVADEPDVALVVVGRRGHSDLAELVLGSVSHDLSHHCSKPLVIIPKTAHEGEPRSSPRGRIVVGVDGSPEAQAALRWAAFEAQVRSATLEVVVVWSVSSVVFPTRVPIPGSVELQLHKEAQDVLDHALARLEATDLAIEPKVLRGDAASVLNHRADAADLLVVGRRGVGRAREVLVGSVGHACIHNSASPVAIIPH